jgi:hypothetical protein
MVHVFNVLLIGHYQIKASQDCSLGLFSYGVVTPKVLLVLAATCCLATSCSSTTETKSSPSAVDDSTSTTSSWIDRDEFLRLVIEPNTIAAKYIQKAITYEELVAEITRVAVALEQIAPSNSQNCNSQISKFSLEVNQLRVALINKIQSDINEAWKVTDRTYFSTVYSLCLRG